MKKIISFLSALIFLNTVNAQCPTFSINAPSGSTVGCVPSTVPLNAVNTSTLSSVTYTWIGSVSGTTTGISINAGFPNTYSVYASSPSSTCITMQMITMSSNTFVPLYKAVFTPTAITCSNPTISMMPMATFPSTVPITFTFTSPAPTSTSNVGGATFSVAGTYTMQYTNTNNGCSALTTTNVPLNTTPPPTFSVGPYYIPCGFTSVVISAGTNSIATTYSYTWNSPPLAGMSCPGGISCYNNQVNLGGTYTVDILNYNTGCSATNTMSVVQYTYLPLSITGNNTICVGETDSLMVSGAINYTWSTSSNNSSIAVSPTTTTTYSVYGTGSSGCAGQASIAVVVSSCVGIKELEWDKNISIAPNPNNGKFNVEIRANIENAEIKIVNAIGQEVYRQNIKQGKNDVNVGVLAKGIYHYSILQNKESVNRGKILIE